MAKEVYRKSVLEKLSSPEQLDRMITIISPTFWLAAMGGGLILAIALIWSIVGRLPVNVTTNGIYMTHSGIHSVYAQTGGTVENVLVSDGMSVSKGQPLVTLDDRQIQESIAKLEARRDSVEVVTFDSVEDDPSADNKSLLDIKSQKMTASSQLVSNRALLEQRRKDLAEQDAKTATAKRSYEAAQKEYFDSIGSSDTSAVQVAYQSAQSELANSRSYLENAKSGLSQAQTSGMPLNTQRMKIETDLAAARTSLSLAQESVETARGEMLAAEREQQEAQAALSKAQTDMSIAQSEQSTLFSEKASADAQLSSARMELENAQMQASTSETNREDQIEAVRSQIKYVNDSIKRYDEQINRLEAQISRLQYGQGNDDSVWAMENELVASVESVRVSRNNARAELEQLQSQLTSLTSNTNLAQDAVQTAQSHVEEAEEKVSETNQRYNAAEANANSATLQYNRLADFASQCASAYNEKSVAYQEANAEVSIAQSKVSTLEAQLESVASQIDAINANVETAEGTLSDWESRVSEAQSRYRAAEERYIQAMQDATLQQAQSNRQSAVYSEAMNQYTTELSLGRNINDSIVQLMAQIGAEESSLNIQNAALQAQFDTTKAALIDQLNRELEELNKQLNSCTIRSTFEGTIYGLNVVEGGSLQQFAVVCKVAPVGETEVRALVCYAPIDIGRKITPGMRVVVYPSTVNRQEYGHMEGTVTKVADYVTSVEDMRNQLGDETLVQSFSQNGPVVAVTCELREDETTVSGYWWSNRKGAKVEIIEGTMASTDIITEEKAPISMLIPLLKEKLTVRRGTASQQSNT